MYICHHHSQKEIETPGCSCPYDIWDHTLVETPHSILGGYTFSGLHQTSVAWSFFPPIIDWRKRKKEKFVKMTDRLKDSSVNHWKDDEIFSRDFEVDEDGKLFPL